MANSPVFRVTTYRIGDGEFAGLTVNVQLRYALSSDYFVMLDFGTSDTSSTAPDNYGVRVTADPFGTGDLAESGGNWLTLIREDGGEADAIGTVTVVECLRANGTAGFRLLSVEEVGHADFPSTGVQSGSDTSATAWGSADRVVLFGGPGGGGTSTLFGTGTTDAPTLGLRFYPSGTNTIEWERYALSTGVVELATSTVYVVEWGSEWDVQRVNVASASDGGDYSNAANYATAALARTVTVADTWVWWCGWAEGDGSGDTWRSFAVVPGSGGSTAPSATESTIAATLGVTNVDWSLDAYVLSHPGLSTAWQYQTLGDGSSREKAFTVAAPLGSETRRAAAQAPLFLRSTEGRRLSRFGGGFNSTSTTLINELAWSVLLTGATEATVYRGDAAPFLAWAGWLQTTDFAGVVTEAGSEPVFRVTQVEVEPGDWSGTTSHDLSLPQDLVANYFVMIEGSVRGDTSGAVPPDTYAARVTADPFGTGDLSVSSGANVLTLTRFDGTGDWSGVVTVVECLRTPDSGGFRLRGVVECAGSLAGDNGVDEQAFAFSGTIRNLDRVVVMAGVRGGGCETTAGSTTENPAVMVAGAMRDADTLVLRRYQSSTSFLDAYTATAYVVEWGSEWNVEQALYVGDARTTWTTFDLPAAVNPSTTWLLAYVCAYDNKANDGAIGTAVTLGDGSSAPVLDTSEVAVRLGIDESVLVQVYALTHAGIRVERDEPSLGNSVASDTLGINAATRGESWGDLSGGEPYVSGYRFAMSWTWTDSPSSGAVTPTAPYTRITGPTSVVVRLAIASTNVVEGWTQTVDLGGVSGRTDGSGFEADSGAYGPIQGLVVRDRWFDSATLSASNEAGPSSGPVVPSDANEGSVFGFGFGTPQVRPIGGFGSPTSDWEAGTEKAVDVKVVSGGALNGQAGIARKRVGDPDANYAGLNALNAFMQSYSPEGTDYHQGTAFYVEAFNRIVVMRSASSTQMNIRYVHLNRTPGHPDNWTNTTNVVDFQELDDSYVSGMDVVELPDGTLYMVVQTDKGSGLKDADAYISRDGGIRWTLVHRNLRTLVTGATSFSRAEYRLSASGDFLRLVMATDSYSQNSISGLDYETWVSPDRGASWRRLTPNIASTAPNGPLVATAAGRWPMDIVGLGDQSGTFLFVVGSDRYLRVYIASGLDAWTAYSGLDVDYNTVSVGDPYAAWLVRDPDRIWLFAHVSNGSSVAELHAYEIDPSDVTEATNWTEWGRVVDYPDGQPDHVPYHTRGFWFGEGICLFGALADVSSVGVGTDNTSPGVCMMFSGRWDRQPWCTTNGTVFGDPTNYLTARQRTMTYAWWSWMGEPSDASGSSWSRLSSGASFQDRAEYQESQCNGSTEYGYWRRNDGTPFSSDRIGNGTIHLVTEVASVMNGVTTAIDHAGARFVEYSTTNSGLDFTIRMTDTGFSVYDNVAGVERYDGSGAYSAAGVRVEWRIAFRNGVEVRWRELVENTRNDSPWNSTGELPLSLQNNATEYVYVGVLSGSGFASGLTSFRWVELVEYRYGFLGQATGVLNLPQDLMGAPMTPGGIHLINGISAKFGGSGAFSTDSYVAEIDYSRGVENLLLDSPQLRWEGFNTSEETVVLQAGTTLTSPRWEPDTFVLFGTNDRNLVLQFAEEDTAAAWSTPAAEVTLSADLYVDLTVVEVNGSSFKLSAADGVLPAPGEAAGRYVRFLQTSGGANETFRIRQDPRGDGWFQLDGEADAEPYLGTSAVIYGDRMIYKGSEVYRYRFVRVVFPDVNTGAGSVSDVNGSRAAGLVENSHQLGTPLFGTWVPLDVPLEWTWTDNEQPNNTTNRTKSGITWGVREGAAQRQITGRIVGDVDEFRQRLRRLLKTHADYNRAPCALVLNGKDLRNDSLLLVRVESGSQKSEAGWYLDDNGNWRTAGDVDLVCSEVI